MFVQLSVHGHSFSMFGFSGWRAHIELRGNISTEQWSGGLCTSEKIINVYIFRDQTRNKEIYWTDELQKCFAKPTDKCHNGMSLKGQQNTYNDLQRREEFWCEMDSWWNVSNLEGTAVGDVHMVMLWWNGVMKGVWVNSPQPCKRKRKRNFWCVVMVKSSVCVCVARLQADCWNSPLSRWHVAITTCASTRISKQWEDVSKSDTDFAWRQFQIVTEDKKSWFEPVRTLILDSQVGFENIRFFVCLRHCVHCKYNQDSWW